MATATSNTTSLTRLLEMAGKGFSRVVWTDLAVYVATGQSAARRGHPGKIVIGLEWYRPEGVGDDDLSTGGWLLPHRSGNARVGKLVAVDTVDADALARVHELSAHFAPRIEL